MISTKTSVATIAVLTLAFALHAVPATAGNAIKQPFIRRNQNDERAHYSSQRFSTPASLPGVPDYPGQAPRFDMGFSFPHLERGRGVLMQFAVREAPQAVLEWYHGSLTAAGWEASKTQDNGRQKMYSRSGQSYCIVDAIPLAQRASRSNPYRTRLQIRYLDKGLGEVTPTQSVGSLPRNPV